MSRYCPSCGKPCSQFGCVCGWAAEQEHPPIHAGEHGDWAAANSGYEKRIRQWVADGVHLQAHHVAFILTKLDQAEAERDTARRALAEQWRSIESAPKMRTILLFAVTDIKDDGTVRNWKMATGSWHTGYEDERSQAQNYTPWTWGDRQLKTYDVQPTHWMPLPDPPRDGIGGGDAREQEPTHGD